MLQLRGGATPLIFAAAHDHLGAIRLLLNAGAFPNARDQFGRTPLHIAANKKNSQVVRALLDAKAKPNALDDDGRSPLYLAASKGDDASVELLLKADADLELRDNDGRSVIDAAIGKSVIDRLVEAGAPRPIARPSESSHAKFLQWAPLSQGRADRLHKQLNEIVPALVDDTWKKWLQAKGQSSAKGAELPFYDNGFLVAVTDDDVPSPNEKFLIWSEPNSFIHMLDWTNDPLFTANEALRWRISEGGQAAAIQYLKFYFFFVRGQLGRFEIAEPGDQLNWLDDADSEQISRAASRLTPIEMLPDPPAGTLQFRFTCVLKNAIFLTDAYLGLRATSFLNDGEQVPLVAGQFRLSNEELLEENLSIRISGPPTAFG